jgi:hypothetical protein
LPVVAVLNHNQSVPDPRELQMRLVISCLASFLLLAGCGGSDQSGTGDSRDGSSGARSERAVSAAVLKKDINLAACLTEESEDTATAGSCPTYILQSLDYMIQECSRVGGELKPMPESAAWSLDVDSDGDSEVMLDLTQNFDCQGAPSVFSCGSLGCPYFVYIRDGDDWNELGAINADDAPGIEVLHSQAKDIPATLRGGCTGQRPCSEFTFYTWNGRAYDRSLIEFRGHKVDVASGGLWTLTRDAAVLDAPAKDAAVVDEYPTGTTVVVIGTARSGHYKFVSPCNACRRGFVDAEVLKKE